MIASSRTLAMRKPPGMVVREGLFSYSEFSMAGSMNMNESLIILKILSDCFVGLAAFSTDEALDNFLG